MNKCPNCGAPVNGSACTYCGTPVIVPKATVPAPPRNNRNLLDKILITVGILWVLIVVAAAIDLRYWDSMIEIMAVLFTAAPGIVLLLIGFRRKKLK